MNGHLPVVRSRYYLGPAFVVEHGPASREGRGLDRGILLLPPMGYEDTCAYRPLRVLADALATQGHVVLRIDWPSLGDSGLEALDPGLMEAWTGAVALAAQSLRARGVRSVTGLGVRAGALISLAAEGLDELVLWGMPSGGGKAYLREERAFHRMAAKLYGEIPADVPPLPEGALEAGGFVFGSSTVKSLEALDALALARSGKWPRVLLIDRDGAAPPKPLMQAFREGGAEVSEVVAPGLGVLLENSYQSELRPEISAAILPWCAAGTAEITLGEGEAGTGVLELGQGVRERPWIGGGGAGELSGILCEPAGGVVLGATWSLLLNAGGIRRSGPNRLWTQAARRLALEGKPSLRLDVRDVGDSDGVNVPHGDLEEMYSEASIHDALVAYDWVKAQGAGAVDVVGLCSGSFLGIQLADRREVRRALLFNGLAFVWNDEARAGGMTSHIKSSLLNGRRWRRLLAGRINAWALVHAMVAKVWFTLRGLAWQALGRRPHREVAALMDRVVRRGTRIRLVSSEGDPSIGYLEAQVPHGKRPPLIRIPGVDHTIRPVWAHARVIEMILEKG